MERRGVYRAVEEASETGRFDDGTYPHSVLSRRLRYDYRENRDLRGILLGNMVAVSALSSHQRIDPRSGTDARRDFMREVFSTIPYMSDDKRGDTERERAVELFNEVADEMERLAKKLSGGSQKVDIESE